MGRRSAPKTSNILSLKMYIGQCLHLFPSKSGLAGVIGNKNCGLCPLVKAYFSSSTLFYSKRNSVNKYVTINMIMQDHVCLQSKRVTCIPACFESMECTGVKLFVSIL